MPLRSLFRRTVAPPAGAPPVLHQPTELKDWQRRASPLSRYGLLAYALLLIDATLYPWSGWRDRGIGAFAYLTAPWSRFDTGFDVVVNMLGYVPLGLLGGLALYPRLRGVRALLLVLASCVLLSAGLEAVQTYLPRRVASRLDLMANAAGALVGVLLALRYATAILDRGRLRELRQRWFERNASFGLVLSALWFLALLYPDAFAFAPGAMLKPVVDALLLLFDWRDSWRLDPGHFVWGEASLAALSVSGAGALLLSLARPLAPRLRMAAVFIALSMGAQTLSAGMSWGQEKPFVWLTAGSQLGLAMAFGVLALLSWMPVAWRARYGVLALCGLILLTALLPNNPYFPPTVSWAYGQFLNFYGLTFGIHLLWPFFALFALGPLAAGAHRERPL